MKKIVLLLAMMLVVGCSNKEINEKPSGNKPKNDESIIVKEPFIDDNPIKIGLYDYTDYGRNLLTEYTAPWTVSKDITVLEAFPTNEQTISSNWIQTVWPEYWDKYTNINDYKIGYFVRFQLTNGDIIEQMILKPSDGMINWNYLWIYVYDDLNHQPNEWYSHIEDKDVKENTLFTSIKITGAGEVEQIVSPIQLMVFTYDGKGDFDSNTNMYLGNSSYTININKKN